MLKINKIGDCTKFDMSKIEKKLLFNQIDWNWIEVLIKTF